MIKNNKIMIFFKITRKINKYIKNKNKKRYKRILKEKKPFSHTHDTQKEVHDDP